MRSFTLPGKGEKAILSEAVEQELGEHIVNNRATGFFSPSLEGVSSTAQELTNLVNTGDSKATLGSTTGVDTNDPTLIEKANTAFVHVPGTATNRLRAFSPDFGFSVDATKIESIVRARIPSGATGLVRLAGTGSSHYSSHFNPSTMQLGTNHLGDGAVAIGGASAPVTISGWEDKFVWFRTRLNRVSALCEYWYSLQDIDQVEGVNWISLGSAIGTNAGLSFLDGQQTQRTFGKHTTTAAETVDIAYGRTVVDDTIFSTVDAKDNTGEAQDTFTSHEQTWLLTKTTTGTRTVWVKENQTLLQNDGTDDFVVLPTSCQPTVTPTEGEYTALVAFRTAGTTTKGLLGTAQGTFEGISVYLSVGSTVVAATRDSGAGAVNRVHTGTLNDDNVRVAGGRWGGGSVRAYNDINGLSAESSITGLTDVNYGTATAPQWGTSVGNSGGSAGGEVAAELFSVAIFHKALTEAEMNAVTAYMKAIA